MAKHEHRWEMVWCLPTGVHDLKNWLPCLFFLTCACGLSGVWYGEESSVLQQRRVHAGERDV